MITNFKLDQRYIKIPNGILTVSSSYRSNILTYLARKSSPNQLYVTKPKFVRSVADQRERYVRVVTDWRHGVIWSAGYYRIDRLTPSSTSNLATLTLTQTPTNFSQWQLTWLGGIK